MRIIMDLVDKIDMEIEDAKEYAEKALELKVSGSEYSEQFKKMSQQELEHSNIIHEYAVKEIEKLRTVYAPPAEMLEVWDKSHTRYIERVAWIKQMLAM